MPIYPIQLEDRELLCSLFALIPPISYDESTKELQIAHYQNNNSLSIPLKDVADTLINIETIHNQESDNSILRILIQDFMQYNAGKDLAMLEKNALQKQELSQIKQIITQQIETNQYIIQHNETAIVMEKKTMFTHPDYVIAPLYSKEDLQKIIPTIVQNRDNLISAIKNNRSDLINTYINSQLHIPGNVVIKNSNDINNSVLTILLRRRT